MRTRLLMRSGKFFGTVLLLPLLALTHIPLAESQTITTAAGNSTWGAVYQVSLDSAGNLYAADSTYHVVYKVDKFGATTIVAGTYQKGGYAGDGALATSALLNSPTATAIGPDGTLYIADANNQRIRTVGANGIITTFAGTGTAGFTGDNGPASAARLYQPFTMAFDKSGNMFFVDYYNHRIRKIATSGVITTVAGGGAGGDGGPGNFRTSRPRLFCPGRRWHHLLHRRLWPRLRE